MKKIEIDTAYEDPTELITLTQKAMTNGLQFRIVSESGEYNGGWPVIEVSGDGQTICEFLDTHGYEFHPDDLLDVE